MKSSSFLRNALTGAWLIITPASFAAEPLDPREVDPVPPSNLPRVAASDVRLTAAGLALQGRTMELNVRLRAVTEVPDAGDPVYYPMPESVPVRWALVNYPGHGDVGAAPAFQTSRVQAFLELPRTGPYTISYTVCPDGPVTVQLGTRSYNLPTQTETITVNSAASLPVRPQRQPWVPQHLRQSSPYMNLTPQQLGVICGDGQPYLVRPRWVTALPVTPFGPELTLIEGSVVSSWISYDDEWRNHRSNDVRMMIRPDPRYYRHMLPVPGDPAPQMLVAWERLSFPERFCPLSGDRISVIGVLAHDCMDSAHPTMIRPPACIAVHRQRAVRIPAGEVFSWELPGGTVQAPAGSNVYVPGIVTDIWANEDAGGIIGHGTLEQQYGLATPGSYNLAGPHVFGPLEFNGVRVATIALPRCPATLLGAEGQSAPRPPLYVKVSSPWEPGAPLPQVQHVTNSAGEDFLWLIIGQSTPAEGTWSCRIEAAWVLPDPQNWGLEQWQVNLRRLFVHNDQDPDYDPVWGAGDFRMFCGLPVSDQGWSRLLDGDENARPGSRTWTPNWATGAGDDVLRRPLGTLDPQRRLGAGLLVYPEDGDVPFWMHGFESDGFYDDALGRIYTRLQPGAVRTVRAMFGTDFSEYGHYSVEVETGRLPGSPGGAVLSPAASAFLSYYHLQGVDTSPAATAPPVVYDPAEEHSTLADGVADVPFWTVPGTLSQSGNAAAGKQTAFAGDLNGDGLGEMAVMVERTGAASEVRIFAGGGRWLDPEPLAVIPPPAGAQRFGYSMACVGDVTGDGVPDLVIGDPYFSSGQLHEGAVFLYDGKSLRDGNTVPLWHRESEEAGALLGWSVAAGGPGGFIAGAPAAKPAGGRKGKGKTEYMKYELGNVMISSFRPTDNEGEQAYGTSVDYAGDLDGDGAGDFLVGAPAFHRAHADEGAVYVYSGAVLDPGRTPPPPVVIPGGQENARFGTCVAGLGDADGDGLSDFVAGAPGAVGIRGTGKGAVSLFTGSASNMTSLTAAWTQFSDTAESELGDRVAGLGDLNGDGLADFGASEPGYNGGTVDMGRTVIFLGRAKARGGQPVQSWTETGVTGFASVAPHLRAAADLNGDGLSDTVMSDPCGGGEFTEHVRVRPGRGTAPVQPSAHPYFDGPPDLPGSLTDFNSPAEQQEALAWFTAHPGDAELILRELQAECKKLPPGSRAQSELFRNLREMQPVMPTALWAQYFGGVDLTAGAAWLIDCGSADDSTDSLGRSWFGDGSFIQQPSGSTLLHPACDDSRLTDRHIPSAVLCSERTVQDVLHYRIPVYDGPCRVVLYFAESKAEVVGPERGGTATPGTRHTVDIEVQGVRTNGFDIADRAAGAPADNAGALHTAVEFVQRGVVVTGGMLNVKIYGQAPGGAVVRAFCVFQEPLRLPEPQMEILTGPSKGDVSFSLGTGNVSALLMAGQYQLTAERSSDLINWLPLTNPSWSEARAHWSVPPQNPPSRRQFFRGAISAP